MDIPWLPKIGSSLMGSLKLNRDPFDGRTCERIDIVNGNKAVQACFNTHVEQSISTFLPQSLIHGMGEIALSPGNDRKNEVATSLSLDWAKFLKCPARF